MARRAKDVFSISESNPVWGFDQFFENAVPRLHTREPEDRLQEYAAL